MNDLNEKGRTPPYKDIVEYNPDGSIRGTHYMADWIKDTHTRVLNLTHNDLDGAVAGIVIKNVYPNSVQVPVNYKGGPDYANAIQCIAEKRQYQAIIFSDFCPDDEMLDAVHAAGKCYLVIDHHQTAKVRDDDPYGTYYVREGKCGALLCYEYFTKEIGLVSGLENLEWLCEVANDHDLWVRKILPLSDDLNTLMYEYGFSTFIDKFIDGLPREGLPEEAKEMLANHEYEVNQYIASCAQKDLPYNGHYIECEKFNSDINKRMTPMYDWLVMAGTEGIDPGMTKLSFRTRRKDINIGATLKELGRGGGGHPAAAGQIIPTEERDEFIQTVGDLLFGK